MKYKVFSILFIIFSFLVIANVPGAIIKAFADGTGIGAYPTNYDPSNPKTKSWFIYELKPGETKEDSITVVNDSDTKTDVKIYAVDATTTDDGAFALLNEDQRQQEVGSWVHLSASVVAIDPHSRVDVPFTISIPKYVTVGDHAGGIIIQQAKQNTGHLEGMALNIVSRVGTRIYETVPGAQVISLDMQDFHYQIVDNHLAFVFTLINKGNTILTPTGKLEIKDFSGKTIDTIDMMNLGSVFPNKPTTITQISKKDAPWFGKFTAIITINYSPLKAISKTMSFFIYIKDWRLALPIPIIIVLIALFLVLRKVLHHVHHIHRISQKSSLPIQGIPARIDIDEEEGKEAKPKKVKKVLHTHKLEKEKEETIASHSVPENIDSLFIARHIKLLVLGVCVIILLLSCLFAFILQDFVFGHIPTSSESSANVTNTLSVTPAPTATPLPTPTNIPVAKADIKVHVLNGSGVAGAAKKIGDTLTNNGFTVLSVGNAPDDVTQTRIQYPNGMQDGADQLQRIVQQAYPNVSEEATDSGEFTIILGQ